MMRLKYRPASGADLGAGALRWRNGQSFGVTNAWLGIFAQRTDASVSFVH